MLRGKCREDEVRANAEYMAANLKQYGWEYVVVDIQWYEPRPSDQYNAHAPLVMDEYSRLLPAVNRFPTAAGGRGFKPLGDYIHSLGLKFGIHILRGIPRQAVAQNTMILGTNYTAAGIADTTSVCDWNTDMYGVDPAKPGAQEYYNSLFQLYAEWGVDYVKVDDIARPYRRGEIELIHKAIKNSGREMVLSLSPGPAPLAEGEHVAMHANLWRMTDDFWDRWIIYLPCSRGPPPGAVTLARGTGPTLTCSLWDGLVSGAPGATGTHGSPGTNRSPS